MRTAMKIGQRSTSIKSSNKKLRRPHSLQFRLIRAIALVVTLIVVVSLGTSIGQALLAPGTDSVAARLAEWGRTHGLGAVITSLEKGRYNLTPPKTGGTIAGGLPHSAKPSPSATAPAVSPTTIAPAPLQSLVTSPLEGEGTWQDLYSVGGNPAARVAFLRPDAVHTSYYVQVVWMDPKLVQFTLHPGYQVPGQPLTAPDQIPPSEIDSILATFNSGFHMSDSRGGYWQNGQLIAPLRTGAASMILATNGELKVENWPGGVPGTGIAAVRQNLDLLIYNGTVSPAATQENAKSWGLTVGNAAFVWRSAIGVRADGSIISVVGPAMTIESLASILHDAGVVNAMELDINQDWANYITYAHPSPGVAVPTVLPPPNPLINAHRYLQPSSRDFVSVLPRPQPRSAGTLIGPLRHNHDASPRPLTLH